MAEDGAEAETPERRREIYEARSAYIDAKRWLAIGWVVFMEGVVLGTWSLADGDVVGIAIGLLCVAYGIWGIANFGQALNTAKAQLLDRDIPVPDVSDWIPIPIIVALIGAAATITAALVK